MTTAIIDGDIVAYRSAASCNPTIAKPYQEPLEVALDRTDALMNRILNETNAENSRIYLSGGSNFRESYNPEYKANRRDVQRPEWLQPVREHLVLNWKATVEDGQEADDALGIDQCSNQGTVLCTIDKDLLMIPGKHYNFVTETFREQSASDAIYHFYYMLIMGDSADNIFGFDGIARHKVPQKLEPIIGELASCTNESDIFTFVRGLYNDDTRLLMNGICLWIRREPEQIWKFPE